MLLIAYSIRANAHEFWIEPTQYQLNDDLINAHLRVGQEFQGMVLMYNPQDFKTFKILSGSKNKKEKIKGILGDVPAINITTNLDNLLIICFILINMVSLLILQVFITNHFTTINKFMIKIMLILNSLLILRFY